MRQGYNQKNWPKNLDFTKTKKISREELAFKVGVCPQQIYKYEMGKNRITVDRLFSVSVALDFRMHDFFYSIDAAENNVMSAMPN